MIHALRSLFLASLTLSLLLTSSCDRGPASTPVAASSPSPAKPAESTPAPLQDSAMNPSPQSAPASPAKITRSDEEWKKTLTPEQYNILRQKGTERPFTGKYWDTKTPGVYKCAACGAVLFSSDAKFDSGCGWPSFDAMIAAGTVEEHTDNTLGMSRTEVTCARCGGHLGHVFDDGPTPTHLRYCINSASIELQPEAKKDGK